MMTNKKKSLLFLVDDDALYLKSLEIEFSQNSEVSVKTFATGELCLENISQHPDIVILDYYLDSVDPTAKNGIETLDKIKSSNPMIEVIMLSSQDKIEVAVNCMKHKAFDYIVKSETAFIRLQKVINTIFLIRNTEKALSWYMERLS
jgi:two-component system, OmpR family, response regulator